MFRVLGNQHYDQHRTDQKLRSWANAVFQNRGVCWQAFPSRHSIFFFSRPNFSRRTRPETLATKAMFDGVFLKPHAVNKLTLHDL